MIFDFVTYPLIENHLASDHITYVYKYDAEMEFLNIAAIFSA